MARARSFANVTACRAVSNPAWCRIFREISCFPPLNIGTLFRCWVLGQDILPSHASLDSGVNEYMLGHRWQCVRLVPSAEMAASTVCSKKGVEMVHEWTGPVTRGNIMCEAHRALYVRSIRTHHYYIIVSTYCVCRIIVVSANRKRPMLFLCLVSVCDAGPT